MADRVAHCPGIAVLGIPVLDTWRARSGLSASGCPPVLLDRGAKRWSTNPESAKGTLAFELPDASGHVVTTRTGRARVVDMSVGLAVAC
jgi:hypothetical protein